MTSKVYSGQRRIHCIFCSIDGTINDMNTLPRLRARGFTLIELLIVIGIIGMLVVISISSFQGSQRNARDTTRKTQVLSVQAAIEHYKSVNNVFAPDYCSVRSTGNNCGAVNGIGTCEAQVSNDTVDTPEPAFDIDSSTAGRTAASGFLLPFMGKPRTQGSTINGGVADTESTSTCTFTTLADTNYPLKLGRIRLDMERNNYWIAAVLENKSTKRNPNGATCYKRSGGGTAAAYYNGAFIAYSSDGCASGGANEDAEYKLFARGSRGDPSP